MDPARWSVEMQIVPPASNKLEAAERALTGEDYGSRYAPPNSRKLTGFSVTGNLKGLVKMFVIGQLMTQFYLGEYGQYSWQATDGIWIKKGNEVIFVVEGHETGRGKVILEGVF